MKYVIIIGAGLGAVMLFLLATAGANTELFERHYQLLVALNAGFVLFLMAVVGYLLWRLKRRLKAGVFGSRLALRLLLIFSLMAVVPGVLVYSVSVQFLGKSIESWFDVKVDRALEGGLNLGRTMLDNLLAELRKKAQAAALILSEQAAAPLPVLNQLLDQSQVQEATLFNQDGKVIAFSSTDSATLFPDMPSAAVMRQVRIQRAYGAVESIPGKGLYLRVVAPVNVLSLNEDIRVLQLLQPVPKQLATDAETVQAVFRDYQELSLSRLGLKRLYGVTLTLALLLSLFSALAAAFLISERLSAPLGTLAEGTRAVAQGDFSRRHPVQSRDELGVLTESFNQMTQQLEDARMAAERTQQEILQAQRTAVWGEVARRLAHEIKNPLTPIQLSAERIQHKLAEKLNEQDADFLRRSTETIVNQVEALKKMVNEFSEYARAPELELRPLDFNQLVQEVLALYETSGAAVGAMLEGNTRPLIRLALASGLPPVKGDSARLRQVIHNLLQNAQDALAGVADPAITVRTEVVPGAGADVGASVVQLSVSDNGGGFSEQVKAHAFEPYVTTKSKGTGLGLPIVKKIVEEHRGMIQIENTQPHGARIAITLPVST